MRKMSLAVGTLLSLLITISAIFGGLAAGAAMQTDEHARNVILLIGDGMGFSQTTLARMDKADWNLSQYENTSLCMDEMERTGYVSTFSANSFVTDSAPASTAMATGYKTNNGVISQDAEAIQGLRDGKNLTTILEIAEDAGLSTGIITTTRITHATPAAFYAHVDNRDNESEIADQLLSSGVEVALGGGISYFIGTNDSSPASGKGKRNDDRNLIDEATAIGYAFVYNGTAFDEVDAANTSKLLGLFDNSHMLYELQRLNSSNREPSLAAMTEKAISLLSQNPKGFFLMVEGGRIDHACHERSLDNTTADTLAFDEAVERALEFARTNNQTLVIVTADHECGGLVLQPENLDSYEAEGVKPVFGSGTTKTEGPRYDFITEMEEATHTAVDVPIMASGPGAEMVGQGRMDNTDVFLVMKKALGL
jgi:alkaline phosphatase